MTRIYDRTRAARASASDLRLDPHSDRRADLACQCIDVDQAADGGLEEEGDGLSMSRAILTAQKHGQLDKRKLHSTLFTWCLKEIV